MHVRTFVDEPWWVPGGPVIDRDPYSGNLVGWWPR
jgi:hypothetical protein